MTSALLQRRHPDFNAILTADTAVNAYNYTDSHNNVDSVFEYFVQSDSSKHGNWYTHGGPYTADETAHVDATITGPGTQTVNDPNPGSSTSLNIAVNHSGTNKFTNEGTSGVNFSILTEGAKQESRTTTGDPDQGSSLAYSVGTANGGTSTLTFTFQVSTSFAITEDVAAQSRSTKGGGFLTLSSTYMDMTIDGSSVTATDKNGNTIFSDTNWGLLASNNHSDQFSAAVTVQNGSNYDVSYDSSLSTYIGSGNRFGLFFQPGAYSDEYHFNWSLNVSVS